MALVLGFTFASAETTRLYCKMTYGWWKVDDAAVAIHYWGGTNGTEWPGVRMTPVEGETDVWYADVDASHTSCIFVRVNGSGAIVDWGAKTADLTIPTDGKNLYTITSEDPVWGNPGVAGAWSVKESGQGGESQGGEGGEQVETRPVYFVNVPGWEAVYAYAWAGEVVNAAWPGVAMTKTDAKVNEKDIYSYAVAVNMVNIIFNKGQGGDGNQTANLELDAAKPYFYDGAWYASVEAIPAGQSGEGGEGGEQTPEDVTVYFVNSHDWQNVGAYVWNSSQAAYKQWPGEAMTKTQNQVNNKDIYSYTFPASYNHVIFNDLAAENGQQTSDLTVQAGKYFYQDRWYAAIDSIPAPSAASTYWMWGNWSGASDGWGWVEMAQGQNGTFVIEQAICGDLGYCYNTIADRAGMTCVESIGLAQGEELHQFDTIAIVLDPTAGTVGVTILGHYVPNYLRVYCNAAHSAWNASGAATTGIYLYGDVVSNAVWPGERMHAVEGEANMYYYDVDRNLYSKIIFTRVNKNDCTISDQDCAYYWGGKTGDLDIPTDEKTMYTITAYTDGVELAQGEWSVKGNQPAEQHTYKIYGNLEAIGSWDGANAVDMPNGVIELQLAAGVECQFKVVVDNWVAQLGFDDVDLECSSDGVVLSDEQYRNVKVVMAQAGTLKVEVVDGKLCVTGNFEVPETIKYYLVGTMTEWAVVKEAQYLFSETVVPGEYMLHTTLTEGQGIKVVGVLGEQQTWYIEGEANEYQVDAAHAGAAVIYFRPAGNTEWSDLDGHIYVAMDEQTGIQNTVSEQKVVKFIENGQLFLLINGTVYTTTGAIR